MSTATAAPRRRTAPRVAMRLELTFARARGHGEAVPASTLDLSTGGARVVTARPLKVDEVLTFDLHCEGDRHVCGECRVLREHVGQTYAVRFERLDGDRDGEELARLTGA